MDDAEKQRRMYHYHCEALRPVHNERYELSKKLPNIIQNLLTSKCLHGAKDSFFVVELVYTALSIKKHSKKIVKTGGEGHIISWPNNCQMYTHYLSFCIRKIWLNGKYIKCASNYSKMERGNNVLG